MNRERVRRSGAVAAMASFALVVLVACGGEGASDAEHEVTRVPVMSDAAAQATKDAASGATPGTGDAGGTAAAAAVTVEVVSQDIAFEPKELTIPANTDVKFVLPNRGAAAHNFSIAALDVSVDIAPGETKEIVVNAPAGTYEYVCNVPGHKEAGMIGTLTVTEDAAAGAEAATPAVAASPVAEAASAATPVLAGTATEEAVATPAEEAAPAATAEAPAAAEQAAADAVEVVSHDIFFEPKELSIPADIAVTVSLPNEGVTLHNFSIDALDISVDIQPGATEEAVISAPAGTYEFYCNVPGHKAAGMFGTLTVE